MENTLAMEEIKREEESINKKLELVNEPKKEDTLTENPNKIEDDTFFHVPIEESLERKKSENEENNEKNEEK